MKIQKTKNEVILDLLERKDWIVDEKNYYLRKYQEWVMNAPYKVSALIVTYGTLERISDAFSLRKKWWGNLIYKVLLVFLFCITLFCLAKMFGSFLDKRLIPHLTNQIYRTDLKIKEILTKLEEKKEE